MMKLSIIWIYLHGLNCLKPILHRCNIASSDLSSQDIPCYCHKVILLSFPLCFKIKGKFNWDSFSPKNYSFLEQTPLLRGFFPEHDHFDHFKSWVNHYPYNIHFLQPPLSYIHLIHHNHFNNNPLSWVTLEPCIKCTLIFFLFFNIYFLS